MATQAMPQPEAGAGAMPPQAQGAASAPQQGGQDQGNAQAGQANRDAMMAFVDVAQRAKALAKLFPEFAEGAAQILQILQQGMASVAGNPERVPERKAPPIG